MSDAKVNSRLGGSTSRPGSAQYYGGYGITINSRPGSAQSQQYGGVPTPRTTSPPRGSSADPRATSVAAAADPRLTTAAGPRATAAAPSAPRSSASPPRRPYSERPPTPDRAYQKARASGRVRREPSVHQDGPLAGQPRAMPSMKSLAIAYQPPNFGGEPQSISTYGLTLDLPAAGAGSSRPRSLPPELPKLNEPDTNYRKASGKPNSNDALRNSGRPKYGKAKPIDKLF